MPKLKTLLLPALLSAVLTMSAQTYDRLAADAIDSLDAGRLDAAERLFKQAIELSPKDARNAMLFANLGNVLALKGQTDDAVAALSMALNFTPLSVPILMSRGSLYLRTGRKREAMADFSNVVDVEPDNSEALFFRAYLFASDGRFAEAEADYAHLLELDPHSKDVALSLVLLYNKQRKFEKAVEWLAKLENEYPDDPDVLLAKANTDYEMGHYELALADLGRLVEIDDNPDIYILRGNVYKMRGMPDMAADEYRTAISLGADPVQLGAMIDECEDDGGRKARRGRR